MASNIKCVCSSVGIQKKINQKKTFKIKIIRIIFNNYLASALILFLERLYNVYHLLVYP